ncbi:amino acid ABC transporter permease [Paenibacillus albidus]|uniref:amino acid ABC transporter permease n=1 Tax=Paenibacillus albidus TaxID=2041023 RepID=UPI001BED3A7B|nr:amino acid ABC transporter permease [Paenibacillus albidus]MBT2289094.1 amino acid ABC transporter permease [Paenibacillus albidus]
MTDYFGLYMKGFLGTTLSSILALAGSFLIGALIAVFRITTVRGLRWFGTGYVEFVRNIPLLLVVYAFYYGPSALGFPLDGFTAGTIGLAVYTSAFIAEAIRAGIMAVPKGQMEAARSSGLNYIQTMQHVILPQAIKLVIPPLGNQFINLIKNSSVLTIVAGLDLMYFADSISTETYRTFDTYIFVALFYLVLTLPLSYGVRVWERRLQRN